MNRIKFKTTLALMATTFFATQPMAQDFAEAMQEMGESATQGYMKPFVQGLGVGMNSQWSYTAKTMSFLGLPVGFNAYIGYPVVMVNDQMKTFSFNGELPIAPLLGGLGLNMSADSLQSLADQTTALTGNSYDVSSPLTVNVEDVPTVYGSKTRKKVDLDDLVGGSGTGVLSMVRDYNTYATTFNDSLDDLGIPEATVPRMSTVALPDSLTLPFRGFGLSFAPTLPPIGATVALSMIPLLDNITLGVRGFPSVGHDDFGSVYMLGFMGQYEITHLVPFLGKLPFLHFSTYYARNVFKITAKENGDEVASVESINQIAMLQASADLAFIVGVGVYGGIGWERSSLNIKVADLQVTDDLTVPGFDTKIDAPNNVRVQVGGRVSFAAFDVYADANFGSTIVYNGGIAIGLNGL